MSTWFALVLVVSVVVTLYLMCAGVTALWSRQLQLLGRGRTLYGPLAQFCGLLMLAPALLAVISAGELSYGIGLRTRPEAAPIILEAGSGSSDDPLKQTRADAKQWIIGATCDFALLGLPFDLLVFVLVDLGGIRAPKRQQPKKPASRSVTRWSDSDFL
jgi:hypothetical protein